MKVGVLFSGGKDSTMALYKASQVHTISCLITLVSSNSESYMFQSLGNEFTKVQAQALDIPLLVQETKGEKEKELEDLEEALRIAKEEFKIEGVVTGAIKSAYQSSRVQEICNKLDLWCFNPLWQIEEKKLMSELINLDFKVVLLGVFSYPLTKDYVGKVLDNKLLTELIDLNKKFGISIAFEGGEAETFVTEGPIFKKKLEFKGEIIEEEENAAYLNINEVKIEDK